MVDLYKIHSNRIFIFFSISTYLKCGSNWFPFLSTIEKKYASKIHRKKRKLIIIIFYWSHVQVQLINTHNNENYDNNLVFEHFGDQNWVLRNRSISKKKLKNILITKYIISIFCTNFLEIKNKYYFPFYWPYEIFNRIHLDFSDTHIALDFMLLRSIKNELPITAKIFQQSKTV